MKKYSVIIHSILLLPLLVVSSCVKETPSQSDGIKALTMNLNVSGDFSSSDVRALSNENGDDAYNENKIVSVDVFFFQGNTLKWKVANSDIIYDASSKQATLPIPDSKRGLFNGTTSYDIYVLANGTADLSSINEGANNLTALKNMIFQTLDFTTKGGSDAQTSFVMDGVLKNQQINLNTPSIGSVHLKRAAAKIRFRLSGVNIPGFTQQGEAVAALIHFSDKSALMDGGDIPTLVESDWKTTPTRVLSKSGSFGEKTTESPFYAYSNDWNTDPTRATYIKFLIPLKDNVTGSVDKYSYKVPVLPRKLTGDMLQYKNRIDRNFLYDVEVNLVNILGSLEEEPVEVEGNYTIKDWSTQAVVAEIKKSEYLVVSEYNVVMPNITNRVLRFNSSLADVKLVDGSVEASYTYVEYTTGQYKTVYIESNKPEFPTISVTPNVASGEISISSPIPQNYIPKDIKFKVTNGPLTEEIVVRQLPPTYFSVQLGTGSKDNPSGEYDIAYPNHYMYGITSLAPDGSTVWGFPPLDSSGCTENTVEVSKMTSPRFMLASQLGVIGLKIYEDARRVCQEYWEEYKTDWGITVRYDDWRLPTKAELKYLDDIQHNPNNPLGIVMRGDYYWGVNAVKPSGDLSYEWGGAYQLKPHSGQTKKGNQWKAYVRCVRDVKE